jgi:hypothetical protein
MHEFRPEDERFRREPAMNGTTAASLLFRYYSAPGRSRRHASFRPKATI